MRIAAVTSIFICGLLVGCGQSQETSYEAKESAVQRLDVQTEAPAEEAAEAAADTAEAVADGAGGEATDVPSADIKVSLPQMAYTYQYGFRMGASEIPDLQKAHADLCESKGPRGCRILNMSQSGSEGDYATAMLEIEVAAPKARAFGGELGKIAESKGGEPIDTSIEGEDLSKQMVDTEARLRARTVLRDRLMKILKNRSGKVSELVEAERGVAAVNEEIDQAQSWLAEMRGRVAFSKMTIRYSAGSPSAGGFFEPIRYAIGSAGSMLGMTIAFIISAFIFLLPWALIIGLLLWSRRKFGWRFRFWRRDEDAIVDAAEES